MTTCCCSLSQAGGCAAVFDANATGSEPLPSPRGSGGFGVLQQHGSMPPELGSADILRLTQPHPNMSYPLLGSSLAPSSPPRRPLTI